MKMDDDEAKSRLKRLWIDHKPAVESFVWRRNATDVDDVVQQVFVTAWRRIADVPDEPRAWLLTVARNVMLHQRRASRRRDALAVRIGGVIEVATRDNTWREAEGIGSSPLSQAWLDLSDAEREVLSLVVWDELTGVEAAQVLGITRVAFAKRLERARNHLRSLLADAGLGTVAPFADIANQPNSEGDRNESGN